MSTRGSRVPKLRGVFIDTVMGSTGGPVSPWRPGMHSAGYIRSTFNGERVLVHRAVYQAIRGPLEPGVVIHHKDEDRQNNALRNLEAMPRGEHTQLHARRRRRKK